MLWSESGIGLQMVQVKWCYRWEMLSNSNKKACKSRRHAFVLSAEENMHTFSFLSLRLFILNKNQNSLNSCLWVISLSIGLFQVHY